MAINKTDWGSAGVPAQPRAPESPIHWRPPQRLAGVLAPGTAIANGDTNLVLVNVLGSGRIRVVALVTGAGGTLAGKWRLADHITNQATNQPATVALVAATENVLDIPNNPGYAYLEVSILAAGALTVSYVDVIQTAEGN